jgi:hypothetical protein
MAGVATPDPGIYTYSAVYYLRGSTWSKKAEGWDLDVSSLIYGSPSYVFVWWWNGSTWTSEVVFGNGGALAGLPPAPPRPGPLGAAVVADATSGAMVLLELALAAGALYGFYLLVKRR